MNPDDRGPYQLAWGEDFEELASAVNTLVKQGYVPTGGPLYLTIWKHGQGDQNPMYVQAMFRAPTVELPTGAPFCPSCGRHAFQAHRADCPQRRPV